MGGGALAQGAHQVRSERCQGPRQGEGLFLVIAESISDAMLGWLQSKQYDLVVDEEIEFVQSLQLEGTRKAVSVLELVSCMHGS